MDCSLAVVLSLLFAAACCAPAGLSVQEEACGDVRSSSLQLNHIAQSVSKEARNGSNNVYNVTTALVWMEAKDMCDPETLKHKPATCLVKILDVLTSYSSAVKMVSGFKSCSQFASKVQPAVLKLHEDMSKCVESRVGMNLQQIVQQPHLREEKPVDLWQEDPLCKYTLDRLFSFSILTARVFAVGDPAHHTAGSAHRCM